MLATLGGSLALLAGLLVLLLPLLVPELSRSRDSVWGALVLVLGLVLVTSADRLSGAPMLAVLCAGLLIGRLGTEVGQGRWRQLSHDEQARLTGLERWRTSLQQLAAALIRLVSLAGASLGGLLSWLQERREASARARESTKRWIRPEPDTSGTAEAPSEAESQPAGEASDAADVTTVESFEAIDQLIEQASAEPNPEDDGASDGGEPADGERGPDADLETALIEAQPEPDAASAEARQDRGAEEPPEESP